MAVTARIRSLLVGAIVGISALIAALIGVLLLLVLVVAGLAQTQGGRDRLARSVEGLLSEPGGSAVRITGIGPGLPARLHVDRIELADASGTWLAVTDLLLAWRPSALLAGRVHVDEVSAGSISLERLPPPSEELAASEPVTPPHLPRLPVAVRIDRLSVGELRLAEAVAGRPMRLGIEGRLAAADDADGEAGHLRTSIAVLPLDAGGGAVLLDADANPATRILGIDASVDEPEGGLVGSLLGLQPRTPLAVRLEGRGPFENWKGSFTASAGGLGRFTSDLLLTWSRDLRLTVAGHAAIEPALLPQLAPGLANGLHVQTTVRQDTDGSVTVEALELAGHGLRLTGDGALAADGTLAFQADLSIEEGALAPGSLGAMRFERADMHAIASGSTQAPAVTASVTIAEVAGPGAQAERLQLQAKASASIGESKGVEGDQAAFATAEIDGSLAGLQLANPSLQAALGEAPVFAGKAAVDAARTRLSVQSLSVDGRSARLAGEGSLGLEDRRLAALVNLQAFDLRAVAAPAGSAASGSAGLVATLEGTLEPPAFTGRLEAEGRKLATGIAALDALIGPEPRIKVPFSWSEAVGLDAPELRLEARNISGDGHLRLAAQPEALDARLRLSVPSLAPLSAAVGNPLSGRMMLQAEARGAPADPQAEVIVRLSDGAAGDVTIEAANATLRVADAVSRPAGRLTLDGTTSLGPVSGSADFELENNRWLRIDQLAARGLGIALDGLIHADLAGPVATGTVHATSRPPETEIRLGQTALQGPVRVDIRLAPEHGRQTIGVNLSGGPLSLRQGSEEQLGLAGVAGEAIVRNAFADPQFTANLRASEISGPMVLHGITLNASGTPAQARLTLTAEGEDPGLQRLEAVAAVTQREDAVHVDVEQLQGRLAGEALRLSQPARIIVAPRGLSLAGLALAVGDGRLSADAELSSGHTAVAMGAESLPVGMARALSDAAPAHGALNAALTLRTEQAQTVGSGSIKLREVGFDQAGMTDEARMDADIDLQLGAGALRIDGAVSGPGNRITLRGRLPVRLPAGETAPIVDGAAPIEARLGIDADLRRLSLLLALPDQRIEGEVTGEVGIGGSLADPVLSGGIDVRDGLYENFVSATLLSNLSARLEPRDRRTLALRLTGTDGGAGHIAGEGEAALLPEGGARARLAVRADDATLIRRDDVTATLNLDMTIDNHGEAPKLSGRIESRQIDIRLLDRLPPSVIILPVKEVGQARFVPRHAGEVAAPVAVGLDLSVSLPRKVFVRGRGLESEWSGELTVTGTSGAPRISGEVSLVRGTLTLAGKRFDLQRGVVSFTGSQKIDPLINAMAEYSSTEITAYVAITGFASQPEITITSQPPLPQSEVLSRVLFNKSSANLGPVEAVQLAAALEALARGESTGENVFSFVRTFLGLDTLAVQPSRSGEGSSLALGSYVSDQIYFGAEQGLADGSKTGSVEVEIAPGISVESEINQSATNGTQGALGLKWKWDY